MRSLFLSIALGIAALALTATLPSQVEARPWRGGWGGPHRSWGGRGWNSRWGWGGRGWYPGWGWGGYYPYGAFYYPGYPYYPNYGMYYPTNDYEPPTDSSAGASSDSLSDPGSGASRRARSEEHTS